MNLKPLGDRVVLKPIDREEMTKGGSQFPTPPKRNHRRPSSRLSGRGGSWTAVRESPWN